MDHYDHRKLWLFSIKYLIEKRNSRVDWNELYPQDHYEKQEEIYRNIRPTLLSNTLVVPTQKIREHVQALSGRDYYGIRQQVEAFQRTNKKTSRTKFSDFLQNNFLIFQNNHHH